MNLENLTKWICGFVLAAAVTGQLPKLQLWIWKAQAQVMRESKTSNWGSPRFFPAQRFTSETK